MPYPHETSLYRSVDRIARSQAVLDFLRNCVPPRPVADVAATLPSLQPQSVSPPSYRPRYVIGIDGGRETVPINNGYPGAYLCYFSVASVMLELDRLSRLDRDRPVDPAAFVGTRAVDADVFVLPGANVRLNGEASAKSSFRRQLFETLSSLRLDSDTETLLDTYHHLMALRPNRPEIRCPYPDCENHCVISYGVTQCPCSQQRPLYATDALRIHEGFREEGLSEEPFTEVLQVVERLWLIHIMRCVEQRGWIRSLANLAIFVDGPLAVFGHPAWLRDAIILELERLNNALQASAHQDLLIIGIEKSGAFLEHFLLLDTKPQGAPDHLPRRTFIPLRDSYIKQHIIVSDSTLPYGRQTYFGRKFFYKTVSGARIVGLSPFLSHEAATKTDDPDLKHFPRLADVLSILDSLVSSRYPDAVVPIIEANAEAAIPRGEGMRILERLAKEHLL